MTDCKILSTPMEKGLKLSAKADFKAVNESIYRQLVGSLIYPTTTRPNLSFTVSFISKFMTAPKVERWTATKRVLRYVKETLDFGILYSRSQDPRLYGYTDQIGQVLSTIENPLMDMFSSLQRVQSHGLARSSMQ